MNSKLQKLNCDHRKLGESLLKDFGEFVNQYENNLAVVRKFFTDQYHLMDDSILPENSVYERLTLQELVESPNEGMSKTLLTLATVQDEMKCLKNDIYALITKLDAMVDVEDENDLRPRSEEDYVKIYDILNQLGSMSERCSYVYRLFLRQLCALHNPRLARTTISSNYQDMWEELSEFLVAVVNLDLMVLREHTQKYLENLQSLIAFIESYPAPTPTIITLMKRQMETMQGFENGIIFKRMLDSPEKYLKTLIYSTRMRVDLVEYMVSLVERYEKDVLFLTTIWMQLMVLSIVYFYLNDAFDRKTMRCLNDMNKTHVSAILPGSVLIYPDKFLIKYVPKLAVYLKILELTEASTLKLQIRTRALPDIIARYAFRCRRFVQEITTIARDESYMKYRSKFNEVISLFYEALEFVRQISDLTKWVPLMHADLDIPMPKNAVIHILHLQEVLQTFQITFYKHWHFILFQMLNSSEVVAFEIKSVIEDFKRGYCRNNTSVEELGDTLAAMAIAEQNIGGPSSHQRLFIAKLAISASCLRKDHKDVFRANVRKLERIISLHAILRELCETTSTWGAGQMFPVYFSRAMENSINFARYFYILQVMKDHGIFENNDNMHLVEAELVRPMGQSIETRLRIQTHLHLSIPGIDPYILAEMCIRYCTPVLYNNQFLNLRYEIQHYLSTMFYNLTTVSMNDFRTYSEMRELAALQYGLETVEDNLPTQTLEQGLDVLEIIRNIDLFVQKYQYNLNNQVYVEQDSTSKHLNTISISHVANSIRSHGIGIMNTTVNYIYQFLQKKFVIFSQFLFDEIIKSRLLKDLKYFNENKGYLGQRYPFDRAEKFNLNIKKLGLKDGQSYLDLFRKLITHIGNAVGFVRVIRSGGRRCLGEIASFLPGFCVDFLLDPVGDDENAALLDESNRALHDTILTITKNYSNTAEYFKLLLKAFQPVFQHSQHLHLKNFFICVPSLIINFVENLSARKDRLNKKNKQDVCITDDGFAMGLAFILALLDQESQLNSLHFDQELKLKYELELHSIALQRDNGKGDANLLKTLELTEKRLLAFKKEYALFYNTFQSAKVFFK